MVRYLRFSDQHKSLMWERWCKGDCLREIARMLERGPSSVSMVLHRTGGTHPSPRSRSARALSLNMGPRLAPEGVQLAQRVKLTKTTATKLKRQWSPQQIAGG